ncbi:hypothetical protein NDU88_002694 [Pleurodeles waltl]|uniref:Uncharacterized protein n=1 Tax=Pleurodeles waltl TaxID=8319 RepID=A0AAV7M1C8_PLEWA|nr:hypothetical protein NDU88_002694 [Pleurodeles waltl]
MSPIASGDRGSVEQEKEPSQQQAAPTEVPETGTTRIRETVLTRSRTKECHVAGEQLRRSCNAGKTQTNNATTMDFQSGVPVEQEDQVQKSQASRRWADAQEMPAVSAKELLLDSRSLGFCRDDKGYRLPLWRTDPARRGESCRSIFPPKDHQQVLLAANCAVSVFGCCCGPGGTRMSPIASGDRRSIEQDKEPSQQQAAPAEVPETGTTRMRETVLTRSRTKESHVAGEQLRRSCNAG